MIRLACAAGRIRVARPPPPEVLVMPVLASWATRRPSFRPQVEPLERRDTPTGLATPSLDYLRAVMDRYHDHFGVYDDVSSADNHFVVPAFSGDNTTMALNGVKMNGSWADNQHSGATALQFQFIDPDPLKLNFGGLVLQNGVLPDPGPPVNPFAPGFNFGTVPNAGITALNKAATKLTFWARGDQGKKIDFFMGGVGWNEAGVPTAPYPDSTAAVKIQVTLTAGWQQYTIDLTGKDLSYVLGGFGWSTNDTMSPGRVTFYVDDIRYELSDAAKAERLNQPRFLRSYTTRDVQPNVTDLNTDDDIDFVVRNAAITYDNALAVQAFLAEGSADGLRRAKLIGDAFVNATKNDRTYTDGRLRSAYGAGDYQLPPGWTPNGRVGTPPVSGYFIESQNEFKEFLQNEVDTGNNAWAMLSLLALHKKTGLANSDYLTAARRLGAFILTQQSTAGTYPGFLRGFDGPDTNLVRRPNASTEHNLDIYAAFTLMHQITGEVLWRNGANHARGFVNAMWDAVRKCYLTGTIDENTRNTNPDQLPLDVQAWSVLALPDLTPTQRQDILSCAEAYHKVTADGYTGFDFNSDFNTTSNMHTPDGVWAEGTAQMAVAYALAGQPAPAAFYRRELLRLEQKLGFGIGVPATPRPDSPAPAGLTTGFGFKYYQRRHVGATAWNVFAQTRYNPFTAVFVKPPPRIAVAADGGGGPHVKVLDPITGNTVLSIFPYDPGFRGGVRVAMGDVTGDKVDDVVTIPGPGGGPHVKVFDGHTLKEVHSFFAYAASFLGGVYVAVGDVNGDGVGDIVTGADAGGGPHVQVYLGGSWQLFRSFFAYDISFRGGVRVAAADVTGDGRADIVTAPGAGGGPHMKVFDGQTLSVVRSFLAYGQAFTGGVYVAAGDLNADGRAEIITGPGPGGGPHVQAFDGQTLALVCSFFAYDPRYTGGVRVAARDLDGDDRVEMITGPGPGGGPQVKAFRGDDCTLLYSEFAFDPAFRGGIFVG
jgi:hypothetical protein